MKELRISYLLAFALTLSILAASSGKAANPAHDFTLESANGRTSLSDFRGKVSVLYFGYTTCPDICPTSLHRISSAIKSLPAVEQKQVQPVFISLDPERDSMKAMSDYLQYFLPNIVGLRGNPDEIAEVAKQYRISYRKTEVENGMDYVIDHASIYFIIGRDGELYSHLLHDVTPDEISEALKQALKEPSVMSLPQVSNAFIRATPPGKKMTGAYMQIHNNSGQNIRMVGASTDIAKKVEIHEHSMSDGMMKMRQVPHLDIKPGGNVELKPGGYHLMFFGLKQPVNTDDRVDIRLEFEGGMTQVQTFIGRNVF